jgi:hypothetical protein
VLTCNNLSTLPIWIQNNILNLKKIGCPETIQEKKELITLYNQAHNQSKSTSQTSIENN